MNTELDYLEDTYQFSGAGKITNIGRGDKGLFVALDKTIMYPQGGGQPSDRGHLNVSGNEVPVTFVGFDDGIVKHFVPDDMVGEDAIGLEVNILVEEASRLRHSKYHTAGHLISHIMETLNTNLVPIKGYHFSDGAHVEFVDEMREGSAEMIEEINEAISEAINANSAISAKLSNYDEVAGIRPELAPFMPKDKPTRMIQIGDFKPLPCGGTHVRDTGSVQGLKVTKIKRKKDNIKVSYSI